MKRAGSPSANSTQNAVHPNPSSAETLPTSVFKSDCSPEPEIQSLIEWKPAPDLHPRNDKELDHHQPMLRRLHTNLTRNWVHENLSPHPSSDQIVLLCEIEHPLKTSWITIRSVQNSVHPSWRKFAESHFVRNLLLLLGNNWSVLQYKEHKAKECQRINEPLLLLSHSVSFPFLSTNGYWSSPFQQETAPDLILTLSLQMRAAYRTSSHSLFVALMSGSWRKTERYWIMRANSNIC